VTCNRMLKYNILTHGMFPWTGIGPSQGLCLRDNTNRVRAATYMHVPNRVRIHGPSVEQRKAEYVIDIARRLSSVKYLYLACQIADKGNLLQRTAAKLNGGFRLASTCSLHT
jgi:wyosine [tRNA(Phe)-imidazoG37] synthetase (radical SAM superfamily)